MFITLLTAGFSPLYAGVCQAKKVICQQEQKNAKLKGYDFLVELPAFDFHPDKKDIAVTKGGKGSVAARFLESLITHGGYTHKVSIEKAEVHTNQDGITYIYGSARPFISEEDAIPFIRQGWETIHNPAHREHISELEQPIKDFLVEHFKHSAHPQTYKSSVHRSRKNKTSNNNRAKGG